MQLCDITCPESVLSFIHSCVLSSPPFSLFFSFFSSCHSLLLFLTICGLAHPFLERPCGCTYLISLETEVKHACYFCHDDHPWSFQRSVTLLQLNRQSLSWCITLTASHILTLCPSDLFKLSTECADEQQ